MSVSFRFRITSSVITTETYRKRPAFLRPFDTIEQPKPAGDACSSEIKTHKGTRKVMSVERYRSFSLFPPKCVRRMRYKRVSIEQAVITKMLNYNLH